MKRNSIIHIGDNTLVIMEEFMLAGLSEQHGNTAMQQNNKMSK